MAELRSLVGAPGFSESEAFAQTLTALTDAFLEAFRTRVFSLVARAYASVPIQLAQTYLGLPQEQVLSSMTLLLLFITTPLLTSLQLRRRITGHTIRQRRF